ncbi:MAG: DUF6624 domain-containing protein [Saprospiraceae bacterium]
MKKTFIQLLLCTLAFISLSTNAFSQEQERGRSEDFNPQLVTQIGELTKRHQSHRKLSSELFRKHGLESKKMTQNDELIREDDRGNRNAAKAIFEKHGYPTISTVGAEKSHEFWVIVQNCDMDVDFQLAVLKVTDKLIHKGEADPKDHAYLSDRVRINLGMKQMYGTQVAFNESKNTYEPYEMNKPEEVDARRKEMNLEPLATYIQKRNKKYDGSIKRKSKSRRLVRKP